MWFKTKQNKKYLTKCKERKNEVAGHRGFSPQDKVPGFQPQWHTHEGLGYSCSTCSSAHRCSADLWPAGSSFTSSMKSHLFHCVLSTVPHTLMCRDVQKPQGASWCGHSPLTHRSCAPRPMGTAVCSEGEWKQNPVNNSKRENTWGQRKHHAWNTQDLPLMGFGVQTLRAVSGGNSMSSVPNPASCPTWCS